MHTVQTSLSIHVATPWQESFAEHVRGLGLAKRSQALATQHVKVFAAWYEAQFNAPFDPTRITNYAMHAYRKHSLDDKQIMARTWNSRRWGLLMLCAWSGCLDAMAGVKDKDSSARSDIHRRLTGAEVHRLHEALERRILSAVTTFEYRDRVRDRVAVILMLEGGLRRDEVARADKADIEISERKIRVLVRHGKGDKERKSYVDVKFRAAFEQWLALRDDPNPALFDGKDSARLSDRSIARIVEDLRAEARIPDLRCHSLRYTAAKQLEQRLNKKGWGRSEVIRACQDFLGHSDAEQTEKYLYSSADDWMSALEEE